MEPVHLDSDAETDILAVSWICVATADLPGYHLTACDPAYAHQPDPDLCIDFHVGPQL